MDFFCVKCKKKVNVEKYEKKKFKTTRGERTAITAACPTCGTKMFKFVKD